MHFYVIEDTDKTMRWWGETWMTCLSVCVRPLRASGDVGLWLQNAHVLLLKDCHCLCAFDNIYNLFKMVTNKPNVWTSKFVSSEFLFQQLSATRVWLFTLMSMFTCTLVSWYTQHTSTHDREWWKNLLPQYLDFWNRCLQRQQVIILILPHHHCPYTNERIRIHDTLTS